jgi:fumarate reductase flavoprotein subunit
VNKNGERFMPEDQIANTTFTGNAISIQPDKVAFSIFDQAMLEYWKKNGGDIISHVHPPDLYEHFEQEWAKDLAAGYDPICEADTFEELAEKAGIDKEGLLATVKEYNEMCAKGHDDLFEKEHQYLRPIGNGKLYCCRQHVGAYGTLGGIKINYKTEVLTDDNKVIPGLYAAGTDACNIYGDSYPFILAGNTMGFCLNSGRIAGENAAKFVFGEED